MDLGSTDKFIEEAAKEDGTPVEGDLDLNSFMSKVDQGGEHFQQENETGIQVDSYQEYPDPSMLPVFANNEGLDSPVTKSNSADPLSPLRKTEEAFLSHESDIHRDDDDDRRISDYTSERMRSPEQKYYYDNKIEEGDFVGLSHELSHNNADEKFKNEVEAEGSNSYYQKARLTVDSSNDYEVLNNEGLDYPRKKSHTSIETANGDFGSISGNYEFEKTEFINKEMDGGDLSYHTEIKEDNYPLETVPSDQERAVAGLDSPLKTQDAMPSPIGPEGHQPISEEKSPHTRPSHHADPSAKQEEFSSPADSEKKPARSPSRSKRRRSPSPEKHSVGRKRASSHDRSSPSGRRKSPSGRTSDSHRRDHSPRKHLSPSPRRRESPRRKDRSASRSPTRRRDSSGHRRDHRGRSRSRSPYERDRYRRSPRRRHSPRRRSPPSGYYSRRRSPRRPWSPPANRSTGIGRPGKNLFVAGFSYITTERDLEKKFSRFGRVTDVRIVRDRRSGESRGFGFLSLERDEDADAAIRALDQTEWNGRIVLVEKSKTSAR